MSDHEDTPRPESGDEPTRKLLPAEPKMSNRIFVTGCVLTILWLGCVYAWWKDDLDQIRALDPNSFGDFLGGF